MTEYIDKLFDRTVPMLQTDMTLRMKRAEALVSNITNAETPGYRAVDVNFGGELERALAKNTQSLQLTDGQHMDVMSESGQSFLVADNTGVTRPDGNNVDIDVQMGRLASTSGDFATSASLVRKKLQMLRTAIRFAQR